MEGEERKWELVFGKEENVEVKKQVQEEEYEDKEVNLLQS